MENFTGTIKYNFILYELKMKFKYLYGPFN